MQSLPMKNLLPAGKPANLTAQVRPLNFPWNDTRHLGAWLPRNRD